MHPYFNIPEELRALRCWICWRYEDIGAKKPTKIPYNPLTGHKADVTDPNTWASFEEALAAVHTYSGLGFVFSPAHNYAFIDLDDTEGDQAALDRQLNVSKEFDSYSEISPSGRGLHIIVKGNVPRGRRRSMIEVYSSERYATMTGNVYNAKPIADCQTKLTLLWAQMGGGGISTTTYQGDDAEKETDTQIIDRAKSAVNGDKFVKLANGQWQDLYQSQSEADFAFIDIIAFYTQSRSQVTRIFRNSPLGQRDKAKRNDYVYWMINKSFDHMLPPIDFDGFKNAINDKLAGSTNGKSAAFDAVNVSSTLTPADTPPIPETVTLPPGLLGEIAQFIYAAAPRPVPEIALSAAIGLMAGITGRAYNVSGTGLNQYVLMIAQTGTGKEAAASGIDRLMNSIRMQVPTSANFIGPSEIASGQALVKHLNKTSQCFVSLLGEFGLRLQSMSNQNANSAEISLRRMLLDLFNKSGHGQMFRASIYADKDKNIEATASPSFSIYGESTPEKFYGALNEDMISEGLLPRFTMIEYHGPRVSLNPNHVNVKPPMFLVDKLGSLAAQAEQIVHAKRVIDVQHSPEAFEMLSEYDRFCDAKINGTNKDVLRQLWNRAHIKVLKLAALVAVGVNIADPTITAEHVIWARKLIETDIHNLTAKFDKGEVGANTGENKQVTELMRTMKFYLTQPWDRVSSYARIQPMHEARIIPYEYLQKRLGAVAAYRLDKFGATGALKRTIQMMIESDRMREVGKGELAAKFGSTGRAFMLNDMRVLD